MLIKMYNPEINKAYNSSFLFHSLKVKTSLEITGNIEIDINNKDNKLIVASHVCGAQLVDGEISYLDFEFIKQNHLDYYENMVNIFSNLINIEISDVSSAVKYGNMTIVYDGRFYVSGISPIENIRNIVYNLISASIIEDYKQRI